MCGIFLFKGPGAPDADLYADQVRYAGRRGPHGHGWWTSETGLHRAPGPLIAAPAAVFGTIIGHSRLSTLGDAGIEGVQPVLTKGADVLAHNGNVYNWADLDATAATDSFALGTAYSEERDAGVSPMTALASVLGRSTYTATALAVLDRAGAILLYRRRLPLYFLAEKTGVYASSGPLQGALEVPAETIMEVETTESAVNIDVRSLVWALK